MTDVTRKPYRPNWSDHFVLVAIDVALVSVGAQLGLLATYVFEPPKDHRTAVVMWWIMSVFVLGVVGLRFFVARRFDRRSPEDETARQLAELRAEIVALREATQRPRRRWWQ